MLVAIQRNKLARAPRKAPITSMACWLFERMSYLSCLCFVDVHAILNEAEQLKRGNPLVCLS